MGKLISIIIRFYNEEKYIGKLLNKIYTQKINEKFDVILVDSGSKDNTVSIALKYPVKLIKIPKEKFSFGYSLNKGIENAEGEICVFISAHCIPYNNYWLTEIVKPFNNEKVAMVYGRQIGDKNLTKFSEHQIFKKWFPENLIENQSYPFANNANSAIRKSVWEKIKFNESLTGLEDVKWAKDALEKGYKLYYNSNAIVFHIHEERYSQIYNRYKREAIALKRIFPEMNFTFLDFIKFFISNTFNDYINAKKERKFFRNIFEIPIFRFMQFWGTYEGYKYRYNCLTEKLRERFYYPPEKSRNEISSTFKLQHLEELK